VAGAAAIRRGERPSELRFPGSLPLSALTSFLFITAVLALVAGCSLDDLPENPSFMTVGRVSRNVAVPGADSTWRRYLVDGFATDPEWAAVAYTYVAVGPENGNQGGSFLVALKAVYDGERVYMLVQWPDAAPDQLGPRLVWDPERNLTPTGCDTLLVDCSSWDLLDADEDRLSIMWDLGDAADGAGTFRERGCQVACHGNMHPLSGAVDIWHWRAARTNPVNYPLIGSTRVGFADDGYADEAGRVTDQGTSFYRDNYRLVPCASGGSGPVPLKVAIALDTDRQPTTSLNDNMRPCEYVFDGSGTTSGGEPLDCTTRENPCREFNQEDVIEWTTGDDLSGLLLTRPFNEDARESRHDVEARGRWEAIVSPGDIQRKGTWTLEMSRLLAAGNGDDIDFDPAGQEPYYLAIAVMNNSGRIHSGSPVIELRFEP
jgi:hypothetical protein